MARSIDSSFYHQAAWKKVRQAYIKSRQGLCEQCLARGRYTPATCVHHIEELTEANMHRPEIAYGYSNLMALCNDCHNEIHGRKVTRRYDIAPSGEIILK